MLMLYTQCHLKRKESSSFSFPMHRSVTSIKLLKWYWLRPLVLPDQLRPSHPLCECWQWADWVKCRVGPPRINTWQRSCLFVTCEGHRHRDDASKSNSHRSCWGIICVIYHNTAGEITNSALFNFSSFNCSVFIVDTFSVSSFCFYSFFQNLSRNASLVQWISSSSSTALAVLGHTSLRPWGSSW